MKIVSFLPYGQKSQESGVVLLLSKYLAEMYQGSMVLSCDGFVSACLRDEDTNWDRSIDHCVSCMKEQEALAAWGSLIPDQLGRYLKIEDAVAIRRTLLGTAPEKLRGFSVDEVSLFDLCAPILMNRYGSSQVRSHETEKVSYLRSLLADAARARCALLEFQRQVKPDLSLVIDSKDFLSGQYHELVKGTTVRFQWNMHERCVQVKAPNESKPYSCELVLDSISGIRSDSKTWPGEIVDIIQGLMAYLGLSDDQLVLPIAR